MSDNEFPREIAASVRRMARHFPAVVVTGARQTGKTTLLTKLFEDYSYVSLDLPAEARLAEEDPQSFLARHPAPLLVDEVQYAPGLFRYPFKPTHLTHHYFSGPPCLNLSRGPETRIRHFELHYCLP